MSWDRQSATTKGVTNLETLVEFLLLLVDYTEAKVDLVGLLKIGLQFHDLRKCFLGVLERTVPIVEDSYAIPKLGLLNALLGRNTPSLLSRPNHT